MIRLSVNVNKVATVRNSRGGNVPDVVEAVRVCVHAGASGITVHPRADRRHVTHEDVYAIAEALAPWRDRDKVEYNLEGDPREDFIALALDVRPDQCTLVPVVPGEITSQAGWAPDDSSAGIADVVVRMQKAGIRVSLFVDPQVESIHWAARMGSDRVELYTEPFARGFAGADDPRSKAAFEPYVRAAVLAHSRGLGINAGHDLDLENLMMFRELPHLDEVSIGHAIVSRAIFVGLKQVVGEYLQVLGTRAH